MQKGRIVVWEGLINGLINNWEKKKSKRQRRKGKIYPFECRVPENRRGDKKAFLSGQCQETKENKRMGKTRDLFKKVRNTKGTFHAKMGTKKDKNSMDLTEAEDTKKRWQEYTELYKKDLHDPDNHWGCLKDWSWSCALGTWFKELTHYKKKTNPIAGKDWNQKKVVAENEMVREHHQLSGHESEQTLGDGEGQGSLACCSLWVTKSQTQLSDWTTTT